MRTSFGVLALVLLVARCAPAEDGAIGPSRWGAADEAGAGNELSAAHTIRAARLVTRGKVYALGIETNSKTPAYPPRGFRVYVVQPAQQDGPLGPNRLSYNDDIVEGWFGVGTQIDGLGHIGVEDTYYNAARGRDFARIDGLKRYGIEKIPPIATRGVLLDMTAVFGKPRLAPGDVFNRVEIDAALARQKLRLQRGDVVLFHTGWMDLMQSDPRAYSAAQPGLGLDGARYLANQGVVAAGADTWALEAVPAENGADLFPVHVALLAENGVYLLENIRTAELARDAAWEFLFVLGPARITGAVQMIINPIAIR